MRDRLTAIEWSTADTGVTTGPVGPVSTGPLFGGDTENAGLENGGPKKYQRLENAGLKMEDQMSLGGKCRTGKWRTKCH